MALQIQKLFILVIAVQVLMHATIVECRFASSLAGSLAGSVIAKAITGKNKHHHHHYHGTPQTTIERGETMANGCYKEKVKEPDSSRPDKFIETEQLVCPPAGQVPIGGVAMGAAPYVPMQQPMVPAAGNGDVIVLSKKTGSYYGNSGSVLMKTGLMGLLLVAIAACFL